MISAQIEQMLPAAAAVVLLFSAGVTWLHHRH